VSEHQLTTLAIGQQLAALRIHYLGKHLIFEKVHTALVPALHGDHIEATQPIKVYRGDITAESVLHLLAAPID
jgi:uncharacterized integral membrane protein